MLFFFSRSSNFYTEEEDKALLKFVMQRKGYGRAGGVQLWKWMERKQAVPGKTVPVAEAGCSW
jgi:hypothetical protein